MKVTIPDVPTHIWQDLYDKAYAYQQMAPWTVTDEDHLFAVKDPVSEEINYCCVLGAVGEFYGLAAYRGRSGLEMHLRLKNGLMDPDNSKIRSMYDAIVLEFCPEEELDTVDRQILKKLKYSEKRKRYAQFRSYWPGYQGWYLTQEEIEFFIIALEAAKHHVEKCKKDSLFYIDPIKDKCLLYATKTDTPSTVWEDVWHVFGSFSPHEEEFWIGPEKIKSLQLKSRDENGAWEASIFTTSAAIHDRERPYWMRVALIVDRNSERIIGMDVIKPEDNAPIALLEKIVWALEQSSEMPGYILFDDPELCDVCEPLLKSLEVQAVVITDMVATYNAQDYLEKQLLIKSR